MNPCTAALLIFAFWSTTVSSAQSVFYQATSRPYDAWYPAGINPDSDPLSQEFVATGAEIDWLDIAVTPARTGTILVQLREGSRTGAILESQEFSSTNWIPGNTHVVFTNHVTLIPGTHYFIEVAFGALPDTYFDFAGTVSVYDYGYIDHDDAYPSGRIWIGEDSFATPDLDFGVGLVIPEVLETNARAITYLEQQGDIRLLNTAHFTNDYVTNYDTAIVRVRLSAWWNGDSMRLEGLSSNLVYFNDRVVATSEGPHFDQDLVITFNSNATALAIETTLRNIIYRNDSDAPPEGPLPVIVVFSNAQGIVDISLTVQIVPINDAPVAHLDFFNVGTFWPDTNPVGFVGRGHRADVWLGGFYSADPEGQQNGHSYAWSSAEQPGWFSDRSFLTNQFARGLNHVTLSVDDGELTNAVTRVIEVVTPAEGLRRLKKSVRAATTGHDRIELLKPLMRAQKSLAQDRRSAVNRDLENFENSALQNTNSPMEVNYTWINCSIALRRAVSR